MHFCMSKLIKNNFKKTDQLSSIQPRRWILRVSEKVEKWILRVRYSSRTGMNFLSTVTVEDCDSPVLNAVWILLFWQPQRRARYCRSSGFLTVEEILIRVSIQQRADGFTVHYADEFHGQRRTDPPCPVLQKSIPAGQSL
jgi:hypothetical protein